MAMVESVFGRPILNLPHIYPGRHWKLKAVGQAASNTIDTRRRTALIILVPKSRKRRRAQSQPELGLGDDTGQWTTVAQYNPMQIINEIRQSAETRRNLPAPGKWRVTHRAECPQSGNSQNAG